MPPLPKPADRRQNRSRKDAGVVELVQLDARPVPDCPGDWLPVIREAWDSFWRSDAAELIAPHHREPLDRLFMWRDRQARVLISADAYRLEADADPFIEGSTGQPKLNPLYDLAAKAEDRALAMEGAIRQLEDRFPLTPQAQLKLGVTFQKRQSLEALNAQMRAAHAGDPVDAADPRALPVSIPQTRSS